MTTHKDKYKALDSLGHELTSNERRVGGYELKATFRNQIF